MKRIFVIDWIMIAAFVPAVCSGVGLHVAGHGTDHELWHGRAVFHVRSRGRLETGEKQMQV